MSKEALIEKAQQMQREAPYDEGHDYEHHRAVVNNCIEIVNSENLEIDDSALSLAAWLHDYERNNLEKNNQVIHELVQDKNLSDKVVTIINEHSFGKEQTLVESKVLFDADKLEYLSFERFQKVARAVKSGNMEMSTALDYKTAWQARIGQIQNLMHFESSKNIFASRMKNFKELIESDPDAREVFANLI